MSCRIAFASLIVLLPAIALAADPPAAQTGASPAPPDPNRRICRRVDDIQWRTGGGRVCKTQREWDRLARQTSEDLEHFRQPPNITISNVH